MSGYIICFLTASLSLSSYAQINSSGLNEERNIYEKIYNAPLETYGKLNATDVEGLYRRKPLLLAFIFTRCTGICNPFIIQLKENLQFAHSDRDYQLLVVSFDPFDDIEAMHQMAKRFGLNENPQWTFAVTDSIESLNRSVGFSPVWDSISQQFDHEALLVGINTEGYITKKLIGIRNPQDMKLMLSSINNVFTPTYRLPGKGNLLSCFNYDPVTGKNMPGLGLLIIALPSIITFLIILTVVSISSARNKNRFPV